MRSFILVDQDGLCAEGLELSDSRVVVVAMRVATSPALYPSMDKMRQDWASAVVDWDDGDAPKEST